MAMSADLLLILFEAAAASLRAGARRRERARPRPRIGQTLRPGPATPLWNELLKQALPHLRKRGEKVKLARILGVPRQRVNDYLRARTACPDAERALLLLCWVARRQQGRELTA
jgi:hypothetical protein